MDQFIEVTRNPSSEGVHHEIHPFLHHLHLREHVWWSCICGGWTVHVLSLLSTQGVATLQRFLVLSLSVCTLLVLFLSIRPCILLV